MRNLHLEHDLGTEDEGINLTPLIDVVFLILITFILVAPMLDLDQIDLATGGGKATKEIDIGESNNPLRIEIHRDNTITLGSKVLDKSNLSIKLKEARLNYPQNIPLLYCDKGSHFGTYQEVKNALEDAGFIELDIVLKPR